ncbi:hypothetical protein FNW02_31245 [Komarekiella sp. 'clone 1']|uniref:Uncharacterized protein n=1 Tax=Komarekiella delphini-convector SJRDD-AB1 TaxID=2593771 RepID=A0AA40T3A7_9NOST|nr:hypothetical protein [Komarekiella delphini-convector]MBD6620148.1 hypothetical protein [Komarekiella delphini-convector SJRDD-AB1]
MSGFILLAIGVCIFFFALRTTDEINRVAAFFALTISLTWGFALTPPLFQLLVEIITVLAAFRVCMRCLNCG